MSEKAWHAPFLFQVFFGLAGFVLCPNGLVVRDLGYHYLLTKSTTDTRWQHSLLFPDA